MYGLVHQGLRALVLDELGEEEWRQCEREAGAGPEDFISARVYDDAITINLIECVSRRLGKSVEACLRQFGAYWVRFCDHGPYGSIMKFIGSDIVSFVANLDHMHQSVVMAMPDARVPSFSIVDTAPGFIRVRYESERSGLEPLVMGLFEGLLERFSLHGAVEAAESGGKFPEFCIRYEPATSLP